MSSFAAHFYQFKKRTNSTEIPGESSLLHTLNVTLKSGSSIVNPTLEIAHGATFTNVVKVNYCHIPLFNRYYFVTNTVYERGIWYLTLKVDVMASYRDEIGADTRFILRSSYRHDPTIPDTRECVVNNYYSLTSNTVSFIDQFIFGTVVVGVTNSERTGLHSSYYAMTYSNYQKLRSALFSTDFLTQIENPAQYIHYCKWFSMECSSDVLPVYTTKVSAIPIPHGQINVEAFQIALIPVKETTITFNIPKPLAITGANDDPVWMCRAPYARYTLHFPGFGEIALNSEMVRTYGKLYCKTQIDLSTGGALLTLSTDSAFSVLLGRYSCDYGVSLPLDTMNSHYRETANGIIATVGGLASMAAGNYVGGAITAGNGLVDALETIAPSVQRFGNVGSIAEYCNKAFIQGDFQLLTGWNSGNNGRPLYDRVKISTIPGYVECGNGYTRISGTSEEYDQVNQIMKGGFYFA